ncbi:MAG: hypothetical protein ACNYPE_12705 [Candidatus Azotimanducaceae bacterium WSBS_2022_MAG_OTU7]
MFGIGAGWNPPEMENHGVKFSDWCSVTQESVEVMKAFWSEEKADLPPTPQHIDYLLEHNVETMILSTPSGEIEACESAIEK